MSKLVKLYCNIVNDDYQQNLFLKTFNSEFSYIEIWFNDQNSKLLEIDNKINITLVMFDHAKQSATDALKTASKRAIQKTAGATGDLIGNKIPDAVAKSYDGTITKASKASLQNSSETVKNKHEKEIHKDIYLQKKGRRLLMI